MTKSNLMVLGVAAVGVGYWMFFRRQAQQPTTGLARPSNYNPAQPSQSYPWQPTNPPRVDNANQPWYNNDRSMMQGPAESGIADFALNLKAGSSVIQSVKDIWGDMSAIFSSPDPKRDLYGSLDFLNNDSFGVDISEVGGKDFSEMGSFDSQYSDSALA